jgi:hypothetical protein
MASIAIRVTAQVHELRRIEGKASDPETGTASGASASTAMRAISVYEPSGPSGSISRPRYVLHVGHIWCGRVGWWQFGQRLKRGAEMPCWARRLSRRDFDVFRFGTAISGRRV